jgi:hypothetical protein
LLRSRTLYNRTTFERSTSNFWSVPSQQITSRLGLGTEWTLMGRLLLLAKNY